MTNQEFGEFLAEFEEENGTEALANLLEHLNELSEEELEEFLNNH